MSIINADNVGFWRQLATDVSADRPSPGRRVQIVGGRKHKGRIGTVVEHRRDRYSDAFRYGGDANLHMREMAGRRGFVCLVRADDCPPTPPFWVRADYTQILKEEP